MIALHVKKSRRRHNFIISYHLNFRLITRVRPCFVILLFFPPLATLIQPLLPYSIIYFLQRITNDFRSLDGVTDSLKDDLWGSEMGLILVIKRMRAVTNNWFLGHCHGARSIDIPYHAVQTVNFIPALYQRMTCTTNNTLPTPGRPTLKSCGCVS